jgi:hypothetical protein
MYYLWLNGAQAGPFTLGQLAEQWQARQINDLTLYWEEGNADWLPLHNIAALLDAPAAPRPPHLPPVPPAIPAVSVAPAVSSPSTVPSPFAAPAPRAESTEADILEQVVWSGHPSLWSWAGSLFWGIILTPLLIGIFILIHVFWSRSSTRYRVTSRRVSVESGIFTRSSRELRIEDIRSIAARANLFGIGDIEFSTAARAEAEVVFQGIAHTERVRDLVKGLQNRVR